MKCVLTIWNDKIIQEREIENIPLNTRSGRWIPAYVRVYITESTSTRALVLTQVWTGIVGESNVFSANSGLYTFSGF